MIWDSSAIEADVLSQFAGEISCQVYARDEACASERFIQGKLERKPQRLDPKECVIPVSKCQLL